MSRYARQMILPEVGAEGQARLAGAHVLVIGAGGLGGPVLQYLAAAGIGTLTLLDPDHVEESNLHRQVLFSMADIGQPKAAAARRHLQAARPDLNLHSHIEALDAENVTRYLCSADLVVDAADSFATSYILSDACLAAEKPLISASVLAQRGYVGGFCSTAPSLRALFPELPETAASCASAGVMGPVVGMIGALQAQMALKTLLRHAPSPLGGVMQIDMAELTQSSFRFDGAPEPETKEILRFTSPGLVPKEAQVIDLRPKAEAPLLAMAQARRLLPAELPWADLCPRQKTVLCCRSGLRAWRAARALQAQGFDQIEILAMGDPA
ncbi:HesA/MoeB/ThiF family protein [Phaeobacter sp. 11ANDIMAR09]|uniref:HesA/MoeB/ThiF family protein n=1 Tax=Phaeobacter sp. 11ANDIMAR09 TaxID=1225647 RepID=UPI000A40D0A4|nr:HesA/MoeB/ThiF family protein [Phaeobacter sp. 11ANDIMAR09]